MGKMAKFDRFMKIWTDVLRWISMVALAALLCVALTDIVGSKVFGRPIPGSIDIIGLLGGIITAFSIGYTQYLGRHIRVDLVAGLMPKRIQHIIGAVGAILCLALFALLIFSCLEYAHSLQESHEKSFTLSIPLFPFVYAMIFAFLPILLIFIKELVESILGE